jgi:DNA-binding NtrC family response regulator
MILGQSGTGKDLVARGDKLIDVLKRSPGNQSQAARMLGVSRVTIWKRIKKYGIDLSTEIS